MTHLRSIRTFAFVMILSGALFGVRATMPTALANCGNQNTSGGCKQGSEPAPAPEPVETPWWAELATFLGNLLTSVGE